MAGLDDETGFDDDEAGFDDKTYLKLEHRCLIAVDNAAAVLVDCCLDCICVVHVDHLHDHFGLGHYDTCCLCLCYDCIEDHGLDTEKQWIDSTLAVE